MEVKCLECNIAFDKRSSELKKHPNSFCSRSCAAKYNNRGRDRHLAKRDGVASVVKIDCKACNKELSRKHKTLKYFKEHYCNARCQRVHENVLYIERWLNGQESGIIGKSGNTSNRIKKYIRERDKCCQLCKQLPAWNGRPLTLQVDHIDGDCGNNKPENLRCLCPNCHTQTETYGSRNKRKSIRVNYKK